MFVVLGSEYFRIVLILFGLGFIVFGVIKYPKNVTSILKNSNLYTYTLEY